MDISKERVEVKILKPKEGFYLTQADNTIDVINRMFFTVIVLAPTDSIENYKEISIEEANIIKKEQDKLAQEASENNQTQLNK